MKKRRHSDLTILLGGLALVIVLVIAFYFLANFLIAKVDPVAILAGIGLIFLIGLFYELKKGANQKKKGVDFLRIANSIRPDFQNEIESFFKSSKRKAKPIDLYQSFMMSKGQAINIDWSGEENEGEIEELIESMTHQKIEWIKTKEVREKQKAKKSTSAKFVIKILKTVDADLSVHNLRLLFLQTDGDSYSFTTVDNKTFEKVLTHLKKDFYPADEL
jgi:hypothetical protein